MDSRSAFSSVLPSLVGLALLPLTRETLDTDLVPAPLKIFLRIAGLLLRLGVLSPADDIGFTLARSKAGVPYRAGPLSLTDAMIEARSCSIA